MEKIYGKLNYKVKIVDIPDRYLKTASINNNTLNLTNQDNEIISFTPNLEGTNIKATDIAQGQVLTADGQGGANWQDNNKIYIIGNIFSIEESENQFGFEPYETAENIMQTLEENTPLAVTLNEEFIITQSAVSLLEFSRIMLEYNDEDIPYIEQFIFNLMYDNDEWTVDSHISNVPIDNSFSRSNIVELSYEDDQYIFNGTIEDLHNPNKNILVITSAAPNQTHLIGSQLYRSYSQTIVLENYDTYEVQYSTIVVAENSAFHIDVQVSHNSNSDNIYTRIETVKLYDQPE